MDWEYVECMVPDYRVYVSKVGGGTVGRAYAGKWEVQIYFEGAPVFEEILTTGLPKIHKQVALIALDMYLNYSEEC